MPMLGIITDNANGGLVKATKPTTKAIGNIWIDIIKNPQ